jgi:chemotaxis protein histidine kinase CheA
MKRNVHSMKGAGASFGLQIVTSICHKFEDQLTALKEGQVPSQEIVDSFLAYVDMLRRSRSIVLDKNLSKDQKKEKIEQISANLTALHGDGQRVALIADESRSIRPLIEASFKQANVRVVFVEDGMVALSRCLHERIDLLVVAGKLKTIDGAGVIAALKLSGQSNVPVCALLTSSGKEKPLVEHTADVIVTRTAEALAKLPQLLPLKN